jgi:protein-tyrosine phosphatase
MNFRSDFYSTLIARSYGRKIGLVRHCRDLARYRLGAFRSLSRVDWRYVNRFVFVCKGNICRSPYAEARARAMGLPCSSFGLEAVAGAPPNPSAVLAALARGLDISAHRARPVAMFPLAAGDLLAVMEYWHARVLRSRVIPPGAQMTLLGLWCEPPRPHIEDPFGLSDKYIETCFELIDNAVTSISVLARNRGANPRL